MVLMAVGTGAVIVVLVFVLNAAALLSSHSALERTVVDAATAGLRSASAGSPVVDEGEARAVIDQVLGVELRSVRFLKEDAAEIARDAAVAVHNPPPGAETVTLDGRTYDGPVVEVAVAAHVCPPVFACVPLRVRRRAALEADPLVPETATPVPPVTVQITLTPVP